MSEIIIIAHLDANEARSLSRQVAMISEEFVILEADSAEKLQLLCNEYGCSLLLLDHRLTLADSDSLLLPEDSILLLQVEQEQVEKIAKQLTGFSRICDMILPSPSTAVLQQKLQSLLEQRSVRQKLSHLQDEIDELSEKLNRAEQTLHSQQYYLDILTERDGLTGLYNRRHLNTVLKNEFQRAKRYNVELTLLFLDIDHLKKINHKSGHLYGDFVLNEIAARLTSNTRDSDSCFRFGSGDFIVLLPQTNIQDGRRAAEKLRNCCVSKPFDNGQTSSKITLSIGIASLLESCPETPEHLINMADTAMYQAKTEGRNRSKVYQDKSDLNESPSQPGEKSRSVNTLQYQHS